MRCLAAVVTALLALVLAAPAAVAEGEAVDVGVFATLDKAAYLPGDVVRMNVLVLNNGPGTATGVVVRSSGDLEFTGWGDLTGPGIKLGPGEQEQLTVTASPNDTGAGMRQRLEVVAAEPDTAAVNNQASVDAFVTAEQVDLTLTVFGDEDADGVVDPGETRAGLQVTVRGGIRSDSFRVRAGADGVARFTGIPGGQYSVDPGLPADWYLDRTTRIRLRAGHNEIALGARHVDLGKLHATIALDRTSYAVGDTVRERVTLTNTGGTDVTDVRAQCGVVTIDYLETNDLRSEGWGELAPAGPGAVVRAGETRTWEFTDVVTQRMWTYGFVILRCDFLVPGMISGAHATARATVPGGRGTLGGTLVSDDKPVPDVTVLLLDRSTGTTVARATSDAAGHFGLPEVPADEYDLRPLGPWRLEDQNQGLQVLAGEHVEYQRLGLLPGPYQRDPDEPAEPEEEEPAPEPQASPVPAVLANTGVNPVELTAFGVLLIVTGALLLRRRPA